MEAMRCEECGDVRWSFRGLTASLDTRCELCGAEMKPERRHPHRGPDRLRSERRDVTPVVGGDALPQPPAAH